jgi:hypothetical protein
MTGHPIDTVRPEALEGMNGAKGRPELSKDRGKVADR